VCVARVNVYLPDELAEEARAAGLNVSSIVQEALRERLRARSASAWLAGLAALPDTAVAHERVVAALDEIRAEGGDEWPEGPPPGPR
jgi:post-segregation antitoxin (ccd killing protein)